MWFVAGGIVVIIAGLVDLVWTTLGTHGGGPMTAPIAEKIWRAMVGLHRRRPHHRLLSFGGSPILLTLLAFWLMLVWAGWTLIFSGSPDAVIDARTRQPADLVTRIYFTGSMMFTAGTSEYVAGGRGWHVASALANASGLFVVTLSITYLLAVLGAIVEKRSLAAAIWDLGGTPEGIIDRAWTRDRFETIDNPYMHLITEIEKFAEQHLAYPILQYFHGESRRTADPLRITALHEALLLMFAGVAPEKQPSKTIVESALDAIRGFSEVIAEEYVEASRNPPPPPDLEILRKRRIPTADEATFLAAVDHARDVRRRLLGMIHEAGWEWKDVFDRKLKP